MSLLHRTRNDDRVDDTTVRSDVSGRGAPPGRDRPWSNDLTPPTVRDVDRTESDDSFTIRERTSTFAPGQLVSLAVGVGFVAFGLVAMIHAGIDGSFGNPVVDVLGFTPHRLARLGRGGPRRPPHPRGHRRLGSTPQRPARRRHGDRGRARWSPSPAEMPEEARTSSRTTAGCSSLPRRAGRAGRHGPAGVALAPGEAQRRARRRPTTDGTVATH